MAKDDDLQKKVEEAKQADEILKQVQDDSGVQDDSAVETQHAASEENEDKQQVADMKEQLVRCMADLQNYKRRAEEDKMRFVKFANAEMLKELLPIIDNFDRAFAQVAEHLSDEPWIKGVQQTHETLVKTLAKLGIKRIPTVGEKLDPTKHEAIMQGFGEKDKILEELEPGYMYHDETLKAAKVKVGDGHKK